MNTELLRRILDKARNDAVSPSAAMAIEDLARDCFTLADACDTHDLEPDELAGLPADWNALKAHALTGANGIDDDDGYSLSDQGAFALWIEKLWSLAQ